MKRSTLVGMGILAISTLLTLPAAVATPPAGAQPRKPAVNRTVPPKPTNKPWLGTGAQTTTNKADAPVNAKTTPAGALPKPHRGRVLSDMGPGPTDPASPSSGGGGGGKPTPKDDNPELN